MTNRRYVSCFAWIVGLSILVGCQLIDGERDWLGRKQKDDASGGPPPQKLVAVWSNSVMNQDGQAPTRGLGGRIYFYDEHHQPVTAEGRLVVYVYDDSSPEGQQRKAATRKFEFTKEQLADQLSYSQIGPSYSVWIPWDAVGGMKASLSVIPVFTDAHGQLVIGEQARHVLPGREPPQLATDDHGGPRTDGSVSTAEHNAPPGSNTEVVPTSAQTPIRKPMLSSSSTWIRPHRSMQRRLAMPPPKNDHDTPRKRSGVSQPTESGDNNTLSSASTDETSVARPRRSVRLPPPRRPVRTSRFARQAPDLERKLPGPATLRSDPGE